MTERITGFAEVAKTQRAGDERTDLERIITENNRKSVGGVGVLDVMMFMIYNPQSPSIPYGNRAR